MSVVYGAMHAGRPPIFQGELGLDAVLQGCSPIGEAHPLRPIHQAMAASAPVGRFAQVQLCHALGAARAAEQGMVRIGTTRCCSDLDRILRPRTKAEPHCRIVLRVATPQRCQLKRPPRAWVTRGSRLRGRSARFRVAPPTLAELAPGDTDRLAPRCRPSASATLMLLEHSRTDMGIVLLTWRAGDECDDLAQGNNGLGNGCRSLEGHCCCHMCLGRGLNGFSQGNAGALGGQKTPAAPEAQL